MPSLSRLPNDWLERKVLPLNLDDIDFIKVYSIRRRGGHGRDGRRPAFVSRLRAVFLRVRKL
jgi:hypothetical protein